MASTPSTTRGLPRRRASSSLPVQPWRSLPTLKRRFAKPAATAPHDGSRCTRPTAATSTVMRFWIASGVSRELRPSSNDSHPRPTVRQRSCTSVQQNQAVHHGQQQTGFATCSKQAPQALVAKDCPDVAVLNLMPPGRPGLVTGVAAALNPSSPCRDTTMNKGVIVTIRQRPAHKIRAHCLGALHFRAAGACTHAQALSPFFSPPGRPSALAAPGRPAHACKHACSRIARQWRRARNRRIRAPALVIKPAMPVGNKHRNKISTTP